MKGIGSIIHVSDLSRSTHNTDDPHIEVDGTSSEQGIELNSYEQSTSINNHQYGEKHYEKIDYTLSADINNNNNNNTDNTQSSSHHVLGIMKSKIEKHKQKKITKKRKDGLREKVVGLVYKILNKSLLSTTENGRVIPISLDRLSIVYQGFPMGKNHSSSSRLKQKTRDSGNHRGDLVLMDERTHFEKPYCENLITSSRYNIYTFIPRQLYAQFSKIANCYFMIIAILQMIPGWSTTGSYTTIVPLSIFIFISMMREAYDDYRRHKLDKDENLMKTNILLKQIENEKHQKNKDEHKQDNADVVIDTLEDHRDHFTNLDLLNLRHNVSCIQTDWKDLKVGDFVYLGKDDWIPADLVLLCSDNENNEVFLETMALDGETNLKTKYPHLELAKRMNSATGLLNTQGKVTVEDPNIDLYNLNGNIELLDSKTGKWAKYPITVENVAFRGSILRNTTNCIGMVIYSGEETKIRMNSIKNPRIKAPKLQKNINFIVLFMVFIVASLSLFSFMAQILYSKKYIDNNHAWYLLESSITNAQSVMGYIIMYNTLIPLSLYVTMELIKLMQSKLMEWDIDMYYKPTDTSCESRTSTILEELGQVSYIFSDKTGTLTDNMMIFRKFSVCGSSFLHNLDELDQQQQQEKLQQQAEELEDHIVKSPTNDSHLSVISDADNSVVNNFLTPSNSLSSKSVRSGNIRKSMGKSSLDYRTSLGRPSLGRPSIDYKNYSSTNYTGRPSIASYIHQVKQTEQIIEESETDADGENDWNHRYSYLGSNASSKTKSKEDTPQIKTTLELIMYVQRNPETYFSKKIKFFLLSLALCHTGLPKRKLAPKHVTEEIDESKKVNGDLDQGDIEQQEIVDDEDERITTEYQASSPDELALIVAARDLGYVMVGKNSNTISIKTYPDGFEKAAVVEEYKILNLIEFNSDRKRMSIFLQMKDQPDKVLLLCKGADNVILERLHNKNLADEMSLEVEEQVNERKRGQAQLVLEQRKSLSGTRPRMSHLGPSAHKLSFDIASRPSLSLQQVRLSMSRQHMNLQNSMVSPDEANIGSIDAFVENIHKNQQEVDNIVLLSRRSIHKQQREKYGAFEPLDQTTETNNNLIAKSLVTAMGPPGSHLTKISASDNLSTKYTHRSPIDESIETYIGGQELCTNQEYVMERTLEALEEFSTEGLRTLLFSYKWVDQEEYTEWAEKYHEAKTALVDRSAKIQKIGELIETEMTLLGATAIEDKLQDGVPEAIDKIRRAGIKMWMLTGDKRETAINIGHSCNLIHDYSTVVILSQTDEEILMKMTNLTQKLETEDVAHSVIVIDGNTLRIFENNSVLMKTFVDLCTKSDVVICCRASPSQKALMVTNIKKTDKDMVTLAIGDGANDIAMIQSADIGVGIAGKEGLQASRSSDYSIGQFRFLLKLLFVHGRYNYSRTCKFVLTTFYKEAMFYLSQIIYQRWTMFSGTSLYEPWSLSMFNTLFTSLPVLCIGMFQKDLKASTLLAIPELYTFGRMSQGFNLKIFLYWLTLGGLTSVMVTFLNVTLWGEHALVDNSIYPLSFINFTSFVFIINVKAQFLETRNRSSIEFTSTIISCGGWLVWCCFLPAIYSKNIIYDVKYGLYHHFGKDYTLWATILLLLTIPLLFDMLLKVLKNTLWPTDSDIFAQLEQEDDIRKKLEFQSYSELHQGWTWDKDPSTFSRYTDKVRETVLSSAYNLEEPLYRNSSSSIVLDDVSKNPDSQTEFTQNTHLTEPRKRSRKNTLLSLYTLTNNKDTPFDPTKYEILPSGKIIRKRTHSHASKSAFAGPFEPEEQEDPSVNTEGTFKKVLAKTLRFKMQAEDDEDIEAIIAKRLKDLE